MFTLDSRPTSRQREILALLESRHAEGLPPPSYREIAAALGLASVNAVAKHIEALRRRGLLATEAGKNRSITLRPVARGRPRRVVHIPLVGSIPAGLPADREQETEGCVSVDIETLGIRPTSRTFALRISGDSMLGKHIVSGDVVIIEHGKEPRSGDVVAALIDGQSTLKTYLTQRGRPFLRAENPKYPDLIPAAELVIQGVMVALIRRRIG
ncbi:MAG: transcriptional repressor LexA [Nitrospira sp.]|nr:transcriptional repressor LexA [Nitrospira sp.]